MQVAPQNKVMSMVEAPAPMTECLEECSSCHVARLVDWMLACQMFDCQCWLGHGVSVWRTGALEDS